MNLMDLIFFLIVFLFDVCSLDIIFETFSLDLANANSVAFFVYLSIFTT